MYSIARLSSCPGYCRRIATSHAGLAMSQYSARAASGVNTRPGKGHDSRIVIPLNAIPYPHGLRG